MNPFELQAELARQWFALVGGLASTVLAVWTPQTAGSGVGAQPQPARQTRRDTTSSLPDTAPFGASLLLFNPMMVLAPWTPWVCPAPVCNPWAALLAPRDLNNDVADPVTANYRSAGGHAVATIIAPGRVEAGKSPEAGFRITPRRRDLN